MNKSIFIMTDQEGIIAPLENEVKKNGFELFICGKGGNNDASLKNISFSTPSFVLSDDLDATRALDILKLCPTTHIIMLSRDLNLSKSTQSEVERTGIYGKVNFIDLQQVSPADLVELLNNMEVEFEAGVPSLSNEETEVPTSTPNEEEIPTTVMTTEDFLKSVESKEEGTIVANETTSDSETKGFDNSHFEASTITKESLMNLKNKTITIFSRKGGCGKSTIAKEMANIYSNVKLPTRFSKKRENLKVCLVDLDFERGNLRTLLGIHNPTPNIYMWFNDILTKATEQKLPLENIRFNKISVLENYVIKPADNRNFYSLITDQGELSPTIIDKIDRLDRTDALQRIVGIMLESLKKIFDILIIDAGSDFNEMSLCAFEKSDDILYIVEPNVTDVENFKVTLDDLTKCESVDLDSVSIVYNKVQKRVATTEKLKKVLEKTCKVQKYDIAEAKQVENDVHVLTEIEYENDLCNFNNQFMFITNNNCRFKTALLFACKELLPIFKSKDMAKTKLASDTGVSAHKQLMLKKKKELAEKRKKELDAKKKSKTSKKVPTKINKIKEGVSSDKPVENNEAVVEKVTPTYEVDTIQDKEVAIAYLKSNLKKETYENFINKLMSFAVVKKVDNFPYLKRKPNSIKSKLWKQYMIELNKHIKNAKKE